MFKTSSPSWGSKKSWFCCFQSAGCEFWGLFGWGLGTAQTPQYSCRKWVPLWLKILATWMFDECLKKITEMLMLGKSWVSAKIGLLRPLQGGFNCGNLVDWQRTFSSVCLKTFQGSSKEFFNELLSPCRMHLLGSNPVRIGSKMPLPQDEDHTGVVLVCSLVSSSRVILY